jgi:hypothetical protein
MVKQHPRIKNMRAMGHGKGNQHQNVLLFPILACKERSFLFAIIGF